PCRITIRLKDQRVVSKEQRGYPGFFTSPLLWDAVEEKFHRLTRPYAVPGLRQQIVSAVDRLHEIKVSELTTLLREGTMGKTTVLHSQRESDRNEDERAFSFIRMNQRENKPRTYSLTEIRGPYYTAMGKRYLKDVLETMGEHVDSLKFAGGSFTLMSRRRLREIIDLAHRYNVLV